MFTLMLPLFYFCGTVHIVLNHTKNQGLHFPEVFI